jgi:hypothetical protein
MRKKRLCAPGMFAVALLGLLTLQALTGIGGTAMAADSTTRPTSPVKLIFVHHSSGQNWLADPGDDFAGGLGIALRDNNYFVSDTNYHWGPPDADIGSDTIGDHTYTGSWWNWFRGPHSSTYLSALYGESETHCSYSRMGSDPGGENTIVMFKSCYPNSTLGGSPSDPVPAIGSNPLRGSDASAPPELTVANAKGIYVDLLNYFRTKQDKLFVVITAPPLASGEYANNARAFNNWLVNDWLAGYPYKNVFVWDYYNVLTSNGGGTYTADTGAIGGNHHRWWNGAVQHQVAYGGNTLAYQSTSPDHPNTAGNVKATAEFVPLLNVAYNRFKGGTPNPPVPQPEQWKSTFYFAEGYTGANFQEYACLENPNASPAAAWITCMFTDGTSRSQYYALAPSSRTTVDVNQLAGAGKELSMRAVSTSANVVAERPMYFNYKGAWSGGSDVVGARAPASGWYFAEGTTLSGFDQYVTVMNPQSSTAHLAFHYMVEGAGEHVVDGTVGAGSRATFKSVDQVGAGKNMSLWLKSDVNIVAERPMYFVYAGLGNHAWTGGHDVLGATGPADNASFAEGTTRGGFEEWLCIQNPNATAIDVNAVFLLGPDQGSPVQKIYHVAPKQRLTISVNKAVGAEKDVSVKLNSSGTFIAERPMYFMYHGAWDGGHDVIGSTPGASALFAEGYTGPNFNEWLCIQNAGSAPANVTVTYFPEGAAPIVKHHSVAGNSRYTIDVNGDAGSGLSISAKVESDHEVLVERPMYFDYGPGWTGGHDVAGYTP